MSAATPIIHMMYFPWDKDQRLKENPEEFDKSSYHAMTKYAPGFEVRLWTYPAVGAFCKEHYPELWDLLQTVTRPVMMVDVLRWVVVHHFGGIYWQFNSTPLVDMKSFLPAAGKSVKLFTEFDLSPDQCKVAASEPIRGGDVEESKRVLIQVFSATPRAAFTKSVVDFLVDRINKYIPRKDYDILFVTGNAAVSTAYDRFGKNDSSVELVSLSLSRGMIKWHYRGTWRTDAVTRTDANEPAPAMDKNGRINLIAGFYFKLIKKHSHEIMFEELDAIHRRSSSLALVNPLAGQLGIRTIFEAPCGNVPVAGVDPGIEYTGGDLSRSVVNGNRKSVGNRNLKFSHVNLFYSRIPRVDLFLCPDYMERISYREAMRILRRIVSSRPRFIGLTSHPLLQENWNAALGDRRPVNFCKEPFCFPDALESIPFPDPGGRPDRCMSVWDVRALAGDKNCCLAGES